MISFTYESPWKFQWDLGGLHNPIGMDLERLTGSTQSVSQPSIPVLGEGTGCLKRLVLMEPTAPYFTPVIL